jgi:uncharacterized protein (TIGR03435 family)
MHAGGTLRFMLSISMQISPNIANDTLLGLPKFADSQRWDILAKVPSTGEGAPNVVRGQPQPPPLSVGLVMLRNLIFDRFEVKTHTEKRDVTVYALSVPNGKHKLTKAAESDRGGCGPDNNAPKPVPNAIVVTCKNMTVGDFAQNLMRMAGGYIDHPIVDASNLEGSWNITLGWTPRNLLQTAATGTEASDPNGISVFEAIEKQLGLKLVKQTKSVPVTVVDHINEKPVE